MDTHAVIAGIAGIAGIEGIERDLQEAVSEPHDLLVIGGGVYGIALAFEAARRGLATLLLERGDFGGETSWNSLRIVHGGLRYLQTLDLPRFRESVREQGWFLRCFPDLVQPLPCLMPLHDPPRGGRLRRPGVLRLALAADRLLARGRALPVGRLLTPAETAEIFPRVDRAGLRGGALWHDAVTPDSHRLLVELLRWARRCGARALNSMEAVDLLVERGRVAGVRAVDRESGESLELRARAVVNCAGPWCEDLARRFDRRFDLEPPGLFRPVLAFNLLLDREPPSQAALAVASRKAGAQTWFLLPWKGRLLAGTAYAPASADMEEAVEVFLGELNAALPGFEWKRTEVLRVFQGRLPAVADGSTVPASRPVIHDHGRHGGPAGLVSVSGVKLTTARAVAERTLATLSRLDRRFGAGPRLVERPAADPRIPFDDFMLLARQDWAAGGGWAS